MLAIAEQNLFKIVKVNSDPYEPIIQRFFQSEFPTAASVSKEDQLEILTAILVGSNNTRFGPRPNPESLVAMREVIRHAIECKDPIPVLVPWGGRKTILGQGVDVAEAVALKQLSCLQNSITKIYPPGMEVRIRIEDTGALYLYQRDGLTGDFEVEVYSHNFQKLINVLNLGFINPVRESTLMNKEEYFKIANHICEPMYNYLAETDAFGLNADSVHYKRLLACGWKGEIPMAQRDFYRNQYAKHDPDLKPAAATQMLAQYFAGSLTRYILKGTVARAGWNDQYIQLSFVPPVPGAPVSLTSRNIYYRTIPEKLSRNHMPAWRSQGYFRIKEDSVNPKLASFHEKIELNIHTTTLTRAGESVTIRTDYILED